MHRTIYTDPMIFDLEMTHIFGAVWVYLAHESQVPRNDDYLTTKLGLRPVIVLRDTHGKLRALFNRCTHRGARVCRETRGSASTFQCPYHGWTYFNTGKLRGVPWPEGYACDFKDNKFNLAQVPRVESYRGFIFGTLNADAPSLADYLGAAKRPIDEWLDRNPGGRVAVREANRLKFKGNWKLAYDNAADGYHVVFSHRSLLEMENRKEPDPSKGMSFYMGKPDEAPMYVQYFGRGHHFKDKRPNVEKRPGALWEMEGVQPGMESYARLIREKLKEKATRALDLAASEPVNINIFPNLSILGNHIQVFHPIAVDETDSTWFATAIVEEHCHLAPRVAGLLGAGHPHHAALGIELEPLLEASLIQQPRFALEQHAALLADLQFCHFQIDALPVGEAFYQVCIELIVDVAHARFFAAPLLRREASRRRTGGFRFLENVVCP